MEIIPLETAIDIVKQYFAKAQEPSLTYLLNMYALKSIKTYYRPFIVAAIMMNSEYKRLVKADIAAWQYNENAYKNLLSLQSSMDNLIMQDAGIGIDYNLSVDYLNEDVLTDVCSPNSETNTGLGIYII